MEKPTKVKVGVSRGIYKLERHARVSRCHFEAKIEAYHAREMVRRVPVRSDQKRVPCRL